MRHYGSWGNYPVGRQEEARRIDWRHVPLTPSADGRTLLPHGLGRSYGDSCLNDGGILLDTVGLNHFIDFDDEQGLLRCEAGVSLEAILDTFPARGWFPPVTPGTKHVTVGGAVANDVHGKNHHRGGTFGRYVTRFELLRSDGSRRVCSPEQDRELYRATIGGLGLTGLITWVELRMRKIESELIDCESIRFEHLDEFFDLARESDEKFEYTAAWVDCLARGRNLGRGHFLRGNHSGPGSSRGSERRGPLLSVPFHLPELLLNPLTIRAFNTLYFHRQRRRIVRGTTSYEPFFYPLDVLGDWNRLYGRRGFLQYQCVVPHEGGREATREIPRPGGRARRGIVPGGAQDLRRPPLPRTAVLPTTGRHRMPRLREPGQPNARPARRARRNRAAPARPGLPGQGRPDVRRKLPGLLPGVGRTRAARRSGILLELLAAGDRGSRLMARRALILGATSGIAQETAKLLAANGDRLFLVARNPERLEVVAADLEVRAQTPVGRLVADLDEVARHEEIVARAAEELGGLDTILVAHGVLGDQGECERDFSVAHRVLHTNFVSAASLLTIAARLFAEQGRGTIVALSSVAGDRGRQSNYVYGSSKGALSVFLQGLRNRLHSQGVSVITVKPGFVDTPMTAHLDGGVLFASPGSVARGIHRAIVKRRDVVYLPWFWRPIMLVIQWIPESFFKRFKL